jgi:isoleucyl-tRNA synthetase
VTRALEDARKTKLIGHPLDAAIEISVPDTGLKELLLHLDQDLSDIFIVSSARIVENMEPGAFSGKEIQGLEIAVKKATGEKCARCWRFSNAIGQDENHPTACDRCAAALQQIL